MTYKKLIYINEVLITSLKLANVMQAVIMCEKFSEQGLDVEFWIRANTNNKEDIFQTYGVNKNFQIRRIKCINFINKNIFFQKIGNYLQYLLYIPLLFSNQISRDTIIYTRDPYIAFFYGLRGYKTCVEMHYKPLRKIIIHKFIIKYISHIVVISEGIKKFYLDNGVFENKIIIAPSGVDIEEFNIKKSMEDSRMKLDLPGNKILLGYVGSLNFCGKEKGVKLAIDTMKYLDDNIILIIVGGENEEILKYQKYCKDIKCGNKVVFTGYKNHNLIPKYLKAFNVLLAAYSLKDHYSYYMSSLKIVEYMASGTPIVSSDSPAIREMLSESNSILTISNNPKDIATGINIALTKQQLSAKLAQKAKQDVQKYAWENRVRKITSFLEK